MLTELKLASVASRALIVITFFPKVKIRSLSHWIFILCFLSILKPIIRSCCKTFQDFFVSDYRTTPESIIKSAWGFLLILRPEEGR